MILNSLRKIKVKIEFYFNASFYSWKFEVVLKTVEQKSG